MTLSQSDFAGALLTPDGPVPDGLCDPEGRPAGKRFDVYRNNVVASLTAALETAFPVIAKLLGPTNFRTLAGAFIRRHPPHSPLMMFYGVEMAEFLAEFPPVASLGYLPDIARLELALRLSYHAEDSHPIDPARLQQLPPEKLVATRFRLAPATRLVRSDWPIHAIWTYNVEDGAPKPQMAAEDVLIVRPGFDPAPLLLPPGGGAFLTALLDDRPLGDAADIATAADASFELAGLLGLLISNDAITELETDP